jgi:hypothetical protein
MLGRRELKSLELLERELVLKSAINRLAIKVELQNLETALRPAERVVRAVRAARPWLPVFAPLAGFLAARSLRHNGSVFSKAMGLLKWIQPLLRLWNQIRSHSAEAAPANLPSPPAPGAGG